MGANGDASTMVISSVLDPQGVPHVDAPVIPDLPLGVIQARGVLTARLLRESFHDPNLGCAPIGKTGFEATTFKPSRLYAVNAASSARPTLLHFRR